MYPYWLWITTRRQNSFYHGLFICYFALLSIYTSLFSEETLLLCVAVSQSGFLCWLQSEHFPLEVPWGSISYQDNWHCPESSLSLHLIIQTVWIYTALPHHVLVINYFSHLPKSVSITCNQLKDRCTPSLYLHYNVYMASQASQSIFSCGM